MARGTYHSTGSHGFLYSSLSRLTALLVLLAPAPALASPPGAANAHTASSTFPLGSSIGSHTLSGAPLMSVPPSDSVHSTEMSEYIARLPPHPTPAAHYTPLKSLVTSHASSPTLNIPMISQFDDTGVYEMSPGPANPTWPEPSRGMLYPCNVLYYVMPICHHWLCVSLPGAVPQTVCMHDPCGPYPRDPALLRAVHICTPLDYVLDLLYDTASPIYELVAQICLFLFPLTMFYRAFRRQRRRTRRRPRTWTSFSPLYPRHTSWGQCRSYGPSLHAFSTSGTAILSFFVAGKCTSPRYLSKRSRGRRPSSTMRLDDVTAFLAAILIAMLSQCWDAACAARSYYFGGRASHAADNPNADNAVAGVVLQPSRPSGHIVSSPMRPIPDSLLRLVLLFHLIEVAAAGDDTSSIRMPRFDGQRMSYRTWMLAFTAWISLRYPDLCGIIDETRRAPAPEAEDAERELYLRHNRQLYGAIAQCVPDWLLNTLHMSTPNNGRAALSHLRVEYGANTPMDRAAAMAAIHKCYLDPRASIDLNQIRFQYDKMREANADLQAAGGAPLADGALITLLDAAIARNHNYDTIRMFVSRANHETFLAHFTDYVHQVRSEMQMTEVANENGPHAAAYPAVPGRPPRSDAGRRPPYHPTPPQPTTPFSNPTRRGRGGRGGRGGPPAAPSRGGRGGRGIHPGPASSTGAPRRSGTIVICFRCGRLGHDRPACQQPAITCTICGGDHLASFHSRTDLSAGQRRALQEDATRSSSRPATRTPIAHAVPHTTPSQMADSNVPDDVYFDALTIPDNGGDSAAQIAFAPAIPAYMFMPGTLPLHLTPSRSGQLGSHAPTSLRVNRLTDMFLHLSELGYSDEEAQWGAQWLTQSSLVPPGAFKDHPLNRYYWFMSQRWYQQPDSSHSLSPPPPLSPHDEDLHLAQVQNQLLDVNIPPRRSGDEQEQLQLAAALEASAPVQATGAATTDRRLTQLWSLVDGIDVGSDSSDDDDDDDGDDDSSARKFEVKRLAAISRIFLSPSAPAPPSPPPSPPASPCASAPPSPPPSPPASPCASAPPSPPPSPPASSSSSSTTSASSSPCASRPASPVSSRRADTTFMLLQGAALETSLDILGDDGTHTPDLAGNWAVVRAIDTDSDVEDDEWDHGHLPTPGIYRSRTFSRRRLQDLSRLFLATPPASHPAVISTPIHGGEPHPAIFDADVLDAIIAQAYEWDHPTCTRPGCVCTSTYNGCAGEYCCRSCRDGRPCTTNAHATPYHPPPPPALPVISRVCRAWRDAWEAREFAYMRQPYPAAAYYLRIQIQRYLQPAREILTADSDSAAGTPTIETTARVVLNTDTSTPTVTALLDALLSTDSMNAARTRFRRRLQGPPHPVPPPVMVLSDFTAQPTVHALAITVSDEPICLPCDDDGVYYADYGPGANPIRDPHVLCEHCGGETTICVHANRKCVARCRVLGVVWNCFCYPPSPSLSRSVRRACVCHTPYLNEQAELCEHCAPALIHRTGNVVSTWMPPTWPLPLHDPRRISSLSDRDLDVLGRLRCWPPQRNTTQILRVPSENRSAALSRLLRQADTLSPQSHCPGDPDDYALPDYVRHRYDDCLSTRVCRLSVAHDYYTRALLVDVLSTFNFDLLWRAGWGRCYYCTVIVTYDELLWQRNLESNGCYQLTHAHTAMCPSCRNQCVIDAVHLPESLAEQEIILHRLYDDIWQGDWTLLTYRVREHWRRLRLFVCYGLRLCKAYNQCARRVRDLGEQLARQEWQMTCEDLPSPSMPIAHTFAPATPSFLTDPPSGMVFTWHPSSSRPDAPPVDSRRGGGRVPYLDTPNDELSRTLYLGWSRIAGLHTGLFTMRSYAAGEPIVGMVNPQRVNSRALAEAFCSAHGISSDCIYRSDGRTYFCDHALADPTGDRHCLWYYANDAKGVRLDASGNVSGNVVANARWKVFNTPMRRRDGRTATRHCPILVAIEHVPAGAEVVYDYDDINFARHRLPAGVVDEESMQPTLTASLEGLDVNDVLEMYSQPGPVLSRPSTPPPLRPEDVLLDSIPMSPPTPDQRDHPVAYAALPCSRGDARRARIPRRTPPRPHHVVRVGVRHYHAFQPSLGAVLYRRCRLFLRLRCRCTPCLTPSRAAGMLTLHLLLLLSWCSLLTSTRRVFHCSPSSPLASQLLRSTMPGTARVS